MGERYEVFEKGSADAVERFEVRDLRVRTRFALDNAFYDEFTPVLGTTCSMVYVALVRHANKEQKTWPSQARVAAQLGISRQWVGRQLLTLEFFNIIKKIRVGKMCTNRYYLIDEKHWRRDFDALCKSIEGMLKKHSEVKARSNSKKVMLTELTSLMSTPVDIDVAYSLHQVLLQLTSNSKDKQERINKKEGLKVKKVMRKTETNPKSIEVGKGTKKKEYFDSRKNVLVTEYYD